MFNPALIISATLASETNNRKTLGNQLRAAGAKKPTVPMSAEILWRL